MKVNKTLLILSQITNRISLKQTYLEHSQTIVNELNQDRELQIDHSGWRELTAYVIDSKGNVSKLKSAGFVGNHNPFLAANPAVTKISEFQSQFPSFILKRGEEVTILTSVKFHPVFPSKSFSLNFYFAY